MSDTLTIRKTYEGTPRLGDGVLRRTRTRVGKEIHLPALDLDLAIVDSISGFHALEGKWTALVSQSGKSHQVFQTFKWLRHWCACYLDDEPQGSSLNLRIVTGHRAGKLVMVWPLIERTTLGLRTVEWMGAPVSQYGDVLLHEGPQSHDWMSAALQFIASRIKPDAIVLKNVRDDSVVTRHLEMAKFWKIDQEQAPYIDLSAYGSFDDFRSKYSTRTRKTRNRKRRRYMEQPGIGQAIDYGGSERAPRVLDILNLKRRWLESRQSLSRALSSERFDKFMIRIATDTNTPEEVMVTSLVCNNRVASGEVGFICRERYVSHVAAYDIAYSDLSLGVLQMENTIEHCFDRGIKTFDLLAPSDPYKSQWASGAVTVTSFAHPLTLKGHLLLMLKLRRWKGAFAYCSAWLPKPVRDALARWVSRFL